MNDHRMKYPRTVHLPWSDGATVDDRILDDVSFFIGERVIVTRKMDGEKDHVTADTHWTKGPLVKNLLKSDT